VAVLVFAVLAASTSVDPTCRSQDTCEDIPATEAVRASAMLQIAARSVSLVVSTEATESETAPSQLSKLCSTSRALQHLDHFAEARECVPIALQEIHLAAVRQHAALLASRVQPKEKKRQVPSIGISVPGTDAQDVGRGPSIEDKTEPPTTTIAPTTTVAPTSTGAVASLDAPGFKETTELCCPPEMELFFNRLLDSMGLDVCSKPHIQGLMHWFACVPDMDFQYMIDVINNGNPCKYWGPKGETCPALSPACTGTYCR